LNAGTIIALFHSSGTVPTDNNWVKSKDSGLARYSLRCLKRRGGSSSGPEERFGLNNAIAHYQWCTTTIMECDGGQFNSCLQATGSCKVDDMAKLAATVHRRSQTVPDHCTVCIFQSVALSPTNSGAHQVPVKSGTKNLM